ncbi:hypothetical protein GPK90_00635 [Clostridium sp. MCC344]|nr:hypothetical protein [Clostridium sp. MCC344]MBT9787877.1 hypothetical protein [Clostridium sp. MCC344]
MNKNSGEKTGARMVENSVQTHVIKLMGIKDAENAYNADDRKAFARWYVDAYQKFYRSLQYPKFDIEGDKIYKWLIENHETLNSFFAKEKKKEEQFTILCDICDREISFAQRKRLKKLFDLENDVRLNTSEAMQEMYTYDAGNIADEGRTAEEYFKEINIMWSGLMDNYMCILEVILDPVFAYARDRLIKAFEREKTHYARVKANKQNSVWPKSDNIYINLYLYARNRFIQKFYIDLIPDYSLFSEIKNFYYNLEKTNYSLNDLGTIYAGMIEKEENEKTIQNNIMKAFQKLKYVKKFKINIACGEEIMLKNYSIKRSQLGEALAAYLFFRKKNHKEEDYAEQDLDKLLRCMYGRILESTVKYSSNENSSDLGMQNVIKEIADYYYNEFHEIFDSLNAGYQMAMLEELTGGMERIYISSIGGKEEQIYYPSQIRFPLLLDGE